MQTWSGHSTDAYVIWMGRPRVAREARRQASPSSSFSLGTFHAALPEPKVSHGRCQSVFRDEPGGDQGYPGQTTPPFFFPCSLGVPQVSHEKVLDLISTSVLYIQASVFPGTCPYKVGFELCSNYVRFDVLIWGIVPHDDVICNF